MQLVVYAESGHADHPGHVVVGHEGGAAGPRYFGFRFDPADLPADHRAPAAWPAFLADNTVRGRVVDETAYVRCVLGDAVPEESVGTREEVAPRVYVGKWGPCGAEVRPGSVEAWYTFRPDDPPRPAGPCYNAATWAVAHANGVEAAFLDTVPNGPLTQVLAALGPRSGAAR